MFVKLNPSTKSVAFFEAERTQNSNFFLFQKPFKIRRECRWRFTLLLSKNFCLLEISLFVCFCVCFFTVSFFLCFFLSMSVHSRSSFERGGKRGWGGGVSKLLEGGGVPNFFFFDNETDMFGDRFRSERVDSS